MSWLRMQISDQMLLISFHLKMLSLKLVILFPFYWHSNDDETGKTSQLVCFFSFLVLNLTRTKTRNNS